MLPSKRKPKRSGILRAPKRQWPRHRKFVKSHTCCVPGCDREPIECAHVSEDGNAGTALKAPDWDTISLCGGFTSGTESHHAEQHRLGHAAFDAKYGIKSLKLSRQFARISPDIAMRKVMQENGIV